MSIHLPKDIVLLPQGDELLVYDLQRNKAFLLNSTSAAVWQQCEDGQSVEQLVAKLPFGPEESKLMVEIALPVLERHGLVRSDVALMNRREALLSFAALSRLALPLVTALAAPSAIMAASCQPLSGSCLRNGSFCSPTGRPCCSCRCVLTGGFNRCLG